MPRSVAVPAVTFTLIAVRVWVFLPAVNAYLVRHRRRLRVYCYENFIFMLTWILSISNYMPPLDDGAFMRFVKQIHCEQHNARHK